MKHDNSKPASSGLTRRQLLKRARNTGLTLAAAQALSPFIFSGCSSAPAGSTIKVGILHSLTGTMAISEKSLNLVEKMAFKEINDKGGVLGKQIEYIEEDPASDFTKVFPDKARKLLTKDKVVAVFGCWTSVSRKNVLPVFEENNGLLFYPVQYEGNECSKSVVYTGAAPNQQILPAIDWLLTKEGGSKKKFYLLGSNYVFPRTANYIIAKYLKTKNITPVAEEYTKLGHTEYANVVQAIVKKNPDVIFSTINGDSNVNFYKELAAQGITAEKCPVVAVSVGEDELKTLPPDTVKGHLAAWNYFQSVDTPKNKQFVANFQKFAKEQTDKQFHDDNAVTDDPIEAAYIGVYLWKLAVEKAGSTDVDKVREAFKSGIEFEAPSGKTKLDPETQHIYKPFMMGKTRSDKQFDIVHKTDIIKPDPYPQVAFPGWKCDWTKGPPVKGENVEIKVPEL